MGFERERRTRTLLRFVERYGDEMANKSVTEFRCLDKMIPCRYAGTYLSPAVPSELVFVKSVKNLPHAQQTKLIDSD